MRTAIWVYRQSETPAEAPPHGLFTVGFYAPDGTWVPESDHNTREAAASWVHYLNGGWSYGKREDETALAGDA